jgi:hypothetical protein
VDACLQRKNGFSFKEGTGTAADFSSRGPTLDSNTQGSGEINTDFMA